MGAISGEHGRASGYIRQTEAFDSRDSTGIRPRLAALADATDLVRIGEVKRFEAPRLHRVLAGQMTRTISGSQALIAQLDRDGSTNFEIGAQLFVPSAQSNGTAHRLRETCTPRWRSWRRTANRPSSGQGGSALREKNRELDASESPSPYRGPGTAQVSPGILTGSIRCPKRDSEGIPHIASGPLPDSEGGTACHTW